MTLSIKELQQVSYEVARENGWHTGEWSIRGALEKIDDELKDAIIDAPLDANMLLMNTDVGFEDDFASELADVMIRIADIAEYLHIDLEIVVKNRLSRIRS